MLPAEGAAITREFWEERPWLSRTQRDRHVRAINEVLRGKPFGNRMVPPASAGSDGRKVFIILKEVL